MLKVYQKPVSSRLFKLFLIFFFSISCSILYAQKDDTSSEETEQKSFILKKEKVVETIALNKDFFIAMGIDLVAVIILLTLIYYPNYKKLDTIFTFVLFNITIFLITYLLNKVKISMGAAFGLFAVFSMLRYRTNNISVKDMTYLYIFIALGLLNAIQMGHEIIIVISAIIITVTFLLDSKILIKRDSSKIITFENIEMMTPEKREDLLKELQKRTGLSIYRVDIHELDYVKDIAKLTAYYHE